MQPSILVSMLLAAPGFHDLWYAVPLIVSISFVYSATRAERIVPILVGAARFGLWVVGFMALALLALYILSARL